MAGSLIFVHGTGVRLADYKSSLSTIGEQLRRVGITEKLVACGWGDPLGVMFEGKSLPDEPDAASVERDAQEFARWSWLIDDPLAELEMLSIRAGTNSVSSPPGQMPRWKQKLTDVEAYSPSDELKGLMTRGGLIDFWDDAFSAILSRPIVPEAFERSEEANELADAGIALARAVVAQICADALEQQLPMPAAALRTKLHDRLVEDWDCKVFGLSDLLANFAKRVGTKALQRRRNAFNAIVSAPLGDILLYQSRGPDIRAFIRRKIENAAPR
ncbi:hypothetical protein ACU4I5_26930 (plasmid) [Ensifer adhaerens]